MIFKHLSEKERLTMLHSFHKKTQQGFYQISKRNDKIIPRIPNMFSQIQILVRISKFSEENSTRFSTNFGFKIFQKIDKFSGNLPRSLQENPIEFSNKKPDKVFFEKIAYTFLDQNFWKPTSSQNFNKFSSHIG